MYEYWNNRKRQKTISFVVCFVGGSDHNDEYSGRGYYLCNDTASGKGSQIRRQSIYPKVVEDFMGFSYQTAKAFFHSFMVQYLETEDTGRIREVAEKASILSYSRKLCKLRDRSLLTMQGREKIRQCLVRIKELTDRVDTLAF